MSYLDWLIVVFIIGLVMINVRLLLKRRSTGGCSGCQKTPSMFECYKQDYK